MGYASRASKYLTHYFHLYSSLKLIPIQDIDNGPDLEDRVVTPVPSYDCEEISAILPSGSSSPEASDTDSEEDELLPEEATMSPRAEEACDLSEMTELSAEDHREAKSVDAPKMTEEDEFLPEEAIMSPRAEEACNLSETTELSAEEHQEAISKDISAVSPSSSNNDADIIENASNKSEDEKEEEDLLIEDTLNNLRMMKANLSTIKDAELVVEETSPIDASERIGARPANS